MNAWVGARAAPSPTAPTMLGATRAPARHKDSTALTAQGPSAQVIHMETADD